MGQAKRRKEILGDAYGAPQVSEVLKRLHDDFYEKIPIDMLGEPLIMGTSNSPIILAAFYPAQKHELVNSAIINGIEFRLLEYDKYLCGKKMLAGIFGCFANTQVPTLVALNEHDSYSPELMPYLDVLYAMLSDYADFQDE
jgi:hypothetical protein